MQGDDPGGLRKEHQSLRKLFEATRAAVAAGEGEAPLDAAARLREALEIHFVQEDSLYYPTILALRPEHQKALRACMEMHDEFRARLARLVDCVRGGARDDALRILDEIAGIFEQHEASEEAVLAAIDGGEASPAG